MESIDIDLRNLDTYSTGGTTAPPSPTNSVRSVNFGSSSGLELLMNDKKKFTSQATSLGKIDDLETELNEISGFTPRPTTTTESQSLSGFLNFGSKSSSEPPSQVQFKSNNYPNQTSSVGQATAESAGTTRSWDGYSKVSKDIPMSTSSSSPGPQLSDRDKRRRRKIMLKKLEEWYEKKLIRNMPSFNDDSTYEEIEDEYEVAMEDKRRKEGIKLQGHWVKIFVNSLEYANSSFDPFGVSLEGWGEAVCEDLDSYEEIFAELHEKYKGGKLSPEVSLLMKLGLSASMACFTNSAMSMASSMMPTADPQMRQSPQMMKAFTKSAVDMLSQQNEGFQFINTMMNAPTGRDEDINTSFGPPPPPIQTKNTSGVASTAPVNPNARPDLRPPTRPLEQRGVDLSMPFASVTGQEKTMRPPPSNFNPIPSRQEMRGPPPASVANMLSHLKPSGAQKQQQQQQDNMEMDDVISMGGGGDSMVSAASLVDIQNTQLPKKTINRRKNKSDRNVVSMTDL